jgi:Zn-dependent peptidase ImmA (M78 family)
MIERLKMEKRAIAFREKYGLSHTEPIKYYHLLEQLGVVTAFMKMSSGTSGMALKVDDYRFMLVNCSTSKGKQHFTIGHELYHLFEQENFTSQVCQTEQFIRKDKEEFCADLFSSHLILPNDGVVAMIPEEQLGVDKITLDTVLAIEQQYECSRMAVLYRLKEIGLMSESLLQEFMKDIIKNAHASKYQRDIYLPDNENRFIGNDYVKGIEKLYSVDKLKEIEYISYMQDIGESQI